MGKRIEYIDVAKTICIFLMVVGHYADCELLLTWIYSFHMPALFIISGMLFKARPWPKTMLSLFVPIVIFSLINLCYQFAMHQISLSHIPTIGFIKQFLHYRYGLGNGFFTGDWFIWALLGLRLFWGDIPWLKPLAQHKVPIASFVLFFMCVKDIIMPSSVLFGGYYICLLIPCLPFFVLGMYLKEKPMTSIPQKKHILIVTLPLLIASVFINGRCGINGYNFGYSYLLFFFNAAISSIILFHACKLMTFGKRFFVVISNGTFLILGLHMALLDLLTRLLPHWLHFANPFFVLILCYYPIVFCDKHAPLLLGKCKTRPTVVTQ